MNSSWAHTLHPWTRHDCSRLEGVALTSCRHLMPLLSEAPSSYPMGRSLTIARE